MVTFSGVITSVLEDPNENTEFDCDSPFASNSLLVGNELFSYRIQMCFYFSQETILHLLGWLMF